MQTVFPHARSPKAEGDAATVRQLVAEAVDSLGELVADHTRLARLELAADVRIYARATGGVVVAALLLTAGYVLGSVAAALALARFTGMPGRGMRCDGALPSRAWARSPRNGGCGSSRGGPR